jgi:hypothetical protein
VGHPDGVTTGKPLLIVKEDSSCCARICCPGQQSLVARFHFANSEVTAGRKVCGMCYSGHQYKEDPQAGVAMTMERKGCCGKWIGCCVCTAYCQDDAYYYYGDAPVRAFNACARGMQSPFFYSVMRDDLLPSKA